MPSRLDRDVLLFWPPMVAVGIIGLLLVVGLIVTNALSTSNRCLLGNEVGYGSLSVADCQQKSIRPGMTWKSWGTTWKIVPDDLSDSVSSLKDAAQSDNNGVDGSVVGPTARNMAARLMNQSIRTDTWLATLDSSGFVWVASAKEK